MTKLKINGVRVEFMIDTGASVNILTQKVYEFKFPYARLKPTFKHLALQKGQKSKYCGMNEFLKRSVLIMGNS